MRLIDADSLNAVLSENICPSDTKKMKVYIDAQPTISAWLDPEKHQPPEDETVLICFSGVTKRTTFFDHAYVTTCYYPSDPQPWDIDADWEFAELTVHGWMPIPDYGCDQEMEKQRNGGWKSCNKDGNPDTDGEYLVTARTERGYRYRRIAKYSAKSRRWDCLNIVIAWQELPEVYQDENI